MSAVVALEIPFLVVAWRRLRATGPGYRTRRFVVLLWPVVAVPKLALGFIRIETGNTPVMVVVFSVLMLAHFGFGYKKVSSPPPPAPAGPVSSSV